MAWRVITFRDKCRSVQVLAKRSVHAEVCHLRLSIRAKSGRMQESALWACSPLEASSRWALFLQGERLPEATLPRLLAERPA